MRRTLESALVLIAAVMPGCLGPRNVNEPLKDYDPKVGYRFDAFPARDDNTDSIFICMTFSGGGTRAAAFAYGVLEALRDIPIPAGPGPAGPRNLLDEIDLISSVSGGSFTAIGYGLWGAGLFDQSNHGFRRRVLEHNIQRDLLLSFLNPLNLLRVPFIALDSIDLAAVYYDETIFDHSTYSDLLARGRRPYVVVNATDVTRRQRFSFTQDDFDLLGSDLTSFPVGRAVAASSAFPMLLSPMRLKYYPGPPMFRAIEDVLSADREHHIPRRHRWAQSLQSGKDGVVDVDPDKHRFLYLLDGGLADNLGLSHVLESYRRGAIRQKILDRSIDKLVVIIVDAATDPPQDLESKRSAPNIINVGRTVGTTGMSNNSAALTGAVRYALLEAHPATRRAYEQCAQEIGQHCPEASIPALPDESKFDAYVIDLSFRQIKDKQLMEQLLSLITGFFLPTEDVQSLLDAGRDLLHDHPEFQRLMRDLNG